MKNTKFERPSQETIAREKKVARRIHLILSIGVNYCLTSESLRRTPRPPLSGELSKIFDF